jgi:glycosyltransferase involved in cell wall biosynthesis
VTIVFWASLAVIAYTYAGYPLAIAVLARLYPRAWKKRRWWLAGERPVSVLMAVHNGAQRIEAQVDHLLTLEPEIVGEVIVISDGSTDATNILLGGLEASRDDARLKIVTLPEQEGKASALNHGIALATGEILLFVDIRPRLAPGAVAELIANFADPRVGCAAGELLLKTHEHDAAATAVSGLYWRYEQAMRNSEAAFDSPVGVYGGFYAVRRSLASTAPAGCILDDMFQPQAILRQGYRSVVDRDAIVTDVWPAKSSGEFTRKVRTLAGNFQLIAMCPWVLSLGNRVLFQLISHKLLRLVVPYFFMLLLLSSFILGAECSGAMVVVAILQMVFWAMALLSLRVELPLIGRIASPAGALLLLNAAAVVGLYRFLFTRGPLWKALWSPAGTATETSVDA